MDAFPFFLLLLYVFFLRFTHEIFCNLKNVTEMCGRTHTNAWAEESWEK